MVERGSHPDGRDYRSPDPDALVTRADSVSSHIDPRDQLVRIYLRHCYSGTLRVPTDDLPALLGLLGLAGSHTPEHTGAETT